MLLQILALNFVLGVDAQGSKVACPGSCRRSVGGRGGPGDHNRPYPCPQPVLSSSCYISRASSHTGAQFPELKVFALGHGVSQPWSTITPRKAMSKYLSCIKNQKCSEMQANMLKTSALKSMRPRVRAVPLCAAAGLGLCFPFQNQRAHPWAPLPTAAISFSSCCDNQCCWPQAQPFLGIPLHEEAHAAFCCWGDTVWDLPPFFCCSALCHSVHQIH